MHRSARGATTRGRRIGLALTATVAAALVAVQVGAPSPVAATGTTWDLTADWSDVANPNGVWAYRGGSVTLPHVPNWTPLGHPSGQPAWAPSTTNGNFLPAWFRAASPSVLPEIAPGDVVVHTWDISNGGPAGEANVTWTSPVDGSVDVTGAVWHGRDISRSNTWMVLKNGVTFTSGAVNDSSSRAAPVDLA